MHRLKELRGESLAPMLPHIVNNKNEIVLTQGQHYKPIMSELPTEGNQY